jgi:hypothetical protein
VSTPPDPPQPASPPQPPRRSEETKGAVIATVVILGIGLLGSIGGVLTGLLIAPPVALLCVILGSILAIFEGTRRFAIGFLVASAVLIFVTAGVCSVVLRSGLGSA